MTIKINEAEYQVLPMSPRQQFHLMRRLSPLMSSMGVAALALLDDEVPKEQAMAMAMGSIGPASEVLAGMPDEQVDYVLDACLTHVERLGEDLKWYKIYVPQPRGAVRMFQDIDGAAELRLVNEVIKGNLAGFFGQLSGGRASSPSAPAARPPASE